MIVDCKGHDMLITPSIWYSYRVYALHAFKSIRHYSLNYMMCLSTYCVRSSSILNSAPGTNTTLGTGIQGAPAPNPLENAICVNKKHWLIYTTLNSNKLLQIMTKTMVTRKQISLQYETLGVHNYIHQRNNVDVIISPLTMSLM